MNRADRRGLRVEPDSLAGSISFTSTVRILDISLSGMAVEAESPLILGQDYTFRLGEDGEQQIDLKGKVQWCRLRRTERLPDDEVRAIYSAGLKFLDVLSDRQAELSEFIESRITMAVDRRIFGRFEIADHPVIRLTSDRHFEVKKINLAGMLVETDFPFNANAEFTVEVNLQGETFRTLARVRNVEAIETGETERYTLGLEFVEPLEKERERLSQFIKRFAPEETDGSAD